MGASEVERGANEPNEGGEMTNEQTMKLMEELGLHDGGVDNWYSDNAWVKFARLVAEHEREACAKVAEWVGQDKNHIGIAAAIRARGQPEPDYEAEFIKDWNEGKARRVSDGKRMVPEREWVGLTKEELEEISEFHFHGAFSGREVYEDIETRLKEKNT